MDIHFSSAVLLILIGLAIGVISGMLGIGGGVLVIPALVRPGFLLEIEFIAARA